MDNLSHHLKKLIKINRQILNQLNKDEASISSIRQAYDEREIHVQKLKDTVQSFDVGSLSTKEIDSLKSLFERFDKQSKKIDHALDYILKESQEKLGDAINTRKAEESYQFLK